MSDDAGRAVRVRSPVDRVISLVPSVTETLLALGERDRIVARTAYDVDPRLSGLPSFGRTLRPNAEAVLALHPDLVVLAAGETTAGLVERLDAFGVPAYVANVDGTTDLYATIDRLGTLLGVPERADSLTAAIRRGLDAVRRRYDGSPRPTVFYATWHAPPRTAGAGTYIDDVISVAGGSNIFGDLNVRWATVGLEELVRRNPDFVVVPVGGGHGIDARLLRTAPGWRELDAVRDGRLIAVDGNLFNRPGPRVVEAARALSRALHPSPGRDGRP